MQCTACGRESMNPDANYCDYCGTLLRTAVYQEPAESKKETESQGEKPVPTWMFLVVMCLPFIPMVGWIAYLVVLFYWGFATSIVDSKKSFARATLIYTAVVVVLGMVLFGSMLGGMMNGLSALPL